MAVSTIPADAPQIPKIIVDVTGITIPSYAAYLAYRIATYQYVYGKDLYLAEDSQDGELLAIWALADYDVASSFVAVFNAYSPSYAVGAGLSSIVKLNGLSRGVSTYSTCDVVCGGQFGKSVLAGALVTDGTNTWALPSFTFPASGFVVVTAVSELQGAITAPKGTLSTISTTFEGWQTVTNLSPASVGAPIEGDPALRQRQRISVAQPSSSVLVGIAGAIAAVSGVRGVQAYENVEDYRDPVTTLPGHSTSFVVTGGDDALVATALRNKKPGGIATYGSTVITDNDQYGVKRNTSFYRPTPVTMTCGLKLKVGPKYTASIGANLQGLVSAFYNAQRPGSLLTIFDVAGVLAGLASTNTFKVDGITQARDGLPLGVGDVPLKFNEGPTTSAANVSLVLAA